MIKVADDDEVVGFALGKPKDDDVLIAELDSGKKIPVGPGRYQVSRARRSGPRAGPQGEGGARARPRRGAAPSSPSW